MDKCTEFWKCFWGCGFIICLASTLLIPFLGLIALLKWIFS